ncbi:MAG: type II secretion system F family protein [Firmicutes bacterium]|nr:type II secretion system F family protein [Bacillota bacterium]
MMLWVIGLYFASFFLLAFGILLMRSPIRKFFGRQVEKYINFTKPEEKESFSLREILAQFINILSPLLAKRSFAANLQNQLERAGVPLRASEFIFFHGAGFVVAILVGYVIAGPIGIILLSVIAGVLPVFVLKRLIRKRENKFHEQLPDTLSLIAGALKAGYSFLQAVDMTVKETSPPMSVEFKRVLTEARLGLPLEQALDNMAKRVGSDSFDWTVMAVKIQREVGGNLAEILEILADTIRERDRVSRQIMVLTAEGRLSALILFLLPFAVGLLLMVINPEYLSMLIKHPLGIAMLALAAMLLSFGGFWLKKVVSIEV